MDETGETKTLGRSERKRLETRERLYAAAADLFVERGYEPTTMTDIAERADAARRTAFNHFPTKGDFTMEWTRRRRERAAAAVADFSGTRHSTIAQLSAYFAELGRITDAESALTEQMMLGWLAAAGPVHDEPILVQDLVPWLHRGQQNGDLRGDFAPAVAADLLRDAYMGALFRWLRDRREGSVQFAEALSEAITLALRGLAAS